MNAAVTITLLMYLVAMFGSSKSIKCYVCNVKSESHDPDCEVIDKETSTYLNECPEDGVKCGTIITFGHQGEVEQASRGCMEKFEAFNCENLQHPHISCSTCETDECNSVSAFDIQPYKESDDHDDDHHHDDDDHDDDHDHDHDDHDDDHDEHDHDHHEL